jgi:hypothetical protein
MAVDKIPFDEKGNMREYTGYGFTEWRDNAEFSATLLIEGYERGRSAVRVIMRDCATSATYPMFISDFVEMARGSRIKYGEVGGKWVGGKKGSNYGLKLVAE